MVVAEDAMVTAVLISIMQRYTVFLLLLRLVRV